MNPFFVVIIVALVLDYSLNLVSELLNLKALKQEIPADLSDVYKPDEYYKSQQYTSTYTRFDLVSTTFQLLVLLAFWLSGGFNVLDQFIRAWQFSPLANGLIFIGILFFANSLLMLPFSIYATYVIEERFGFNRTSVRTFISDRIKGLALTLVIGAPLMTGVLALFEYAGPLAWLYCWIIVTLYTLVIQFAAPTWIMPLFNKFTPMEAGELREAIVQYAGDVDFSIKNVYVMDGSKRSSKSNAFFTGFGRNKRIALFDTLIEKHSVAELVAVLAHEIGHYKKKHILQSTVIGILHTGLLFFLLSVFLNSPGLYQAFYIEQPSVYTGLLIFGLLYTPIELILSFVMQMLSRKNEYGADRFAADSTGNPDAMVDALKKLSSGNLSNLTPHPFYVLLNYSHPPLLQRIRAIQHKR
jgi:STE24 endopeptidase